MISYIWIQQPEFLDEWILMHDFTIMNSVISPDFPLIDRIFSEEALNPVFGAQNEGISEIGST